MRRRSHCRSRVRDRASIGFGLRVTTLGHVVRGGVPTTADRVLATRLGAAAVDQLAGGRWNVLVGLRGSDTVTTPLAQVAGKTKGINQELLALAQVLAQ
jgi:6-phosphofructokinase